MGERILLSRIARKYGKRGSLSRGHRIATGPLAASRRCELPPDARLLWDDRRVLDRGGPRDKRPLRHAPPSVCRLPPAPGTGRRTATLVGRKRPRARDVRG